MTRHADLDARSRAFARWATVAILAVAVVRMLVAVQQQVRFDTDPAINPGAFAGIGPTGSFVLDIALLFASGLGLLAEGRRRGIHGWLVACAVLPGIPVLWHGLADAAHLFRGATWLAAAFAAVSAAHLARDPALRRLLIAGCIAVTVPLALRGAEQILIDHPNTVEFFEKNKADMLTERGWTADGPAAQMFERRLRQVEASGWFGLANLFSAVMAFGTLAFIGLGVAGVRARARGASLAALAAGALCAVFLAINGSKGAMLATVFGGLVLVVARVRPRLAPSVALAAIALAALAPALRGLVSESFLGEKSLLFRFQYLQGAIAALPESLPFGLGPDGFQNAYLRLKPPRSPEDVTSAHSMAVDWIVLLGPLAIAWVVLVVRAIMTRGNTEGAVADDSSPDLALRGGVMIAAVVFAVQAIADQSIADGVWIALRLLGAASLIGACVLADRLLREITPNAARAVLLAAVTAVFAQAQIEMILFQPGPVVWAMVALGATMTLSSRAAATTKSVALAVACPALAAIVIAISGALPQLRQDLLLDEAAESVAGIADIRAAWPNAAREIASGSPGAATQRLIATVRDSAGVENEAAIKAAIASSNDTNSRLAATMQALQRYDANQRAQAADILQRADAAYPQSKIAIEAAVKQLAAAGRRTLGPRRAEIVEPMLHTRAIELAMAGAQRFGGAKFPAMLADLWLERARALRDAPTFDDATIAVRAAIERQPRAARLHADLADLLAAKGDLTAAIDEYRAALKINADLELDPLAQFNERQKQEIDARLARVAAAQSGGEPLPAGWPFAR